MRASALTATVLLLALAWCTDAALPRLHFLNPIQSILSSAPTATQAESLVVPEPTKYKNPKPLIGVLSQACHYCPGK